MMGTHFDLEWANRSLKSDRPEAADMVVTAAEPGHTCTNCGCTPAVYLVDEGSDWDDASVYPNGHHPSHKRFWYWCGCDGGG